LSYVQQCDVIIASDSSIKTMSSMLKIPTLVWLADYRDPPRDSMFIDSYTQAGVMEVFWYKNFNDLQDVSSGIDLTKIFIKNNLFKK
jgi:hypothetical protein